VIADFSMQRDDYGQLETFTSFKRFAPEHVSEEIQELYDEMGYCERKSGMEGSLLYLEKFLEEKELSYNEYLEVLVKPKGVLHGLLGSFKKVLS